MNDYLDPDHWCNGRDEEGYYPDAQEYIDLETQVELLKERNRELLRIALRLKDSGLPLLLPSWVKAVKMLDEWMKNMPENE